MTPVNHTRRRAVAVGALAMAPALAAAGWTDIPIYPHLQPYVSSARVCKVARTGAYGPVWSLNFQVFRKDVRLNRIKAYSLRFPFLTTISSQSNDQWLFGVVSGTGGNVFASAFFDDRFLLYVDFNPAVPVPGGIPMPSAGLAEYKPGQIANC